MKKISILLIVFVLCVALLCLASCASNAFKPSDATGEIRVIDKSSASASAMSSADADPSATVTEYQFEYELLGDGNSYQIVDNGTYTGKTIVIPATYNEKPVTTIAPYAFKNCRVLESITFSENISDININAFYNCTALKEIKVNEGNAKYKAEGNCLIEISTEKVIMGCSASVIPNTVTAIGEHAFYACAGLRVVDIPASVTSISDKAYYKCQALEVIQVNAENAVYTSKNSSSQETNCLIERGTKKVILTCTSSNIPADTSAYGVYAFSSNTSITTLTIPDGTVTISFDMLKECGDLEVIVIPSSVTSVLGYAFTGCPKLRTIQVLDEEHSAFKVESGCLIKKDTNTVVVGAVGAVIPNYVTTIGEKAFYGRNITSISIPASVKTIKDLAFSRCSMLSSATFAVTEGWYYNSSAWSDSAQDYVEVKVPIESMMFSTSRAAINTLTTTNTAICRD